MNTPHIPRLLRRARVPAGIVLLGALAASLYGFSNSVEVFVDGEAHEVRTYAGTVEEVLERLDLDLGPADEVQPDPATPVSNGLTVDITRAITVDVEVHGAVARRVTATVDDVASVLELAGLDEVEESGAIVEPTPAASVDDGDVVRVTFPTEVVVAVDGQQHELATFADDVDEVLDELGVELRDEDVVLPGEGSALVGPTTIVVQRVETREVVEEVTLEHDVRRRETDQLRRGRTEVAQAGRDGVREDRYAVTLVDGEETERELLSQQVVRQPEDRVIRVGTAPPPPPPAPARSTTSSSRSSSGSSSSGSSSSSSSSGSTSGVWDRLAQCESNGNWSINTGNGYYGGLQFALSTWRSVGGTGYPHEHSRAEQIRRGEILQQRSGWGQWPACSRRLGLR